MRKTFLTCMLLIGTAAGCRVLLPEEARQTLGTHSPEIHPGYVDVLPDGKENPNAVRLRELIEMGMDVEMRCRG